MLKDQRTHSEWRILVAGLVALDVVGLAAAVLLAYYARFVVELVPYTAPLDPGLYLGAGLAIAPAWLMLFWIYHLYDLEVLFGGLREYESVVTASSVGVMLLIIATFFIRPESLVSRGWLALLWGISILAICSLRFLARRLVYRLRSKGLFVRRAIIAGADYQGTALARHLSPAVKTGVEVVGFAHEYLAPGSIVSGGLRVLGDPIELNELAHENEIDLVIVVPGALSWDSLQAVTLAAVGTSAFECRMLPGLYDIVTTGITVDHRMPAPFLSLHRMRITGFNRLLKSILDYMGTALLLLATAPVAVLLILLSLARNERPIIDGRRYVGISGRPFQALAFKGWWNGDGQENPNALERFLRSRRLYRLPGLLNVLRGEMSLVGPRRLTAEDLSRQARWQHSMLSVKPGLTGPWLLAGGGAMPLQDSLDLHLVQLDLQYVRNYTIWLDLEILFRTIKLFITRGFEAKALDRNEHAALNAACSSAPQAPGDNGKDE